MQHKEYLIVSRECGNPVYLQKWAKTGTFTSEKIRAKFYNSKKRAQTTCDKLNAISELLFHVEEVKIDVVVG